jgi:hypothetical protein
MKDVNKLSTDVKRRCKTQTQWKYGSTPVCIYSVAANSVNKLPFKELVKLCISKVLCSSPLLIDLGPQNPSTCIYTCNRYCLGTYFS